MGLLVCLLSLAAIFFGEGGFFQGLSLACLVGLLLFLKLDFSVGLLVCLLSLAAMFFCEGVFFSGPVTGLLGRPAAFHGVGFLQ